MDFLHSDIYAQRNKDKIKGTPGTITISKPVINLLAQRYPGIAYWPNGKLQRVKWFKMCLLQIKTSFSFHKDVSIGFPYRIGCGLAGGDWTIYKKILEDFNKNNKNISLVMYKY